MKRKRDGFTLVELMVVAVIVAILAAVAIPLMSANKTRAMVTEAEAGCGTIRTALRAMYAETSAYNVDLTGSTIGPAIADVTVLPGISTADLDGKYFSEGDYSLTVGPTTYSIRAQGATGSEVAGVDLVLNQDGDWTTKTIP